jgi:hypothetical protein
VAVVSYEVTNAKPETRRYVCQDLCYSAIILACA